MGFSKCRNKNKVPVLFSLQRMTSPECHVIKVKIEKALTE
jgi:hypothetical protein